MILGHPPVYKGRQRRRTLILERRIHGDARVTTSLRETMAGPNYISNPALWEQFRHTEDGKDFIPAIRRHVQRGGGILNRRRAYMIPVKKSAPIPQVTPVEAD